MISYIKQILIEIDGNGEISDGLLEHAEAGIAASAGQVVFGVGLLALFDDSLEIRDGVIEVVEGEIEGAPEIHHLIVFR